MCANRGLAVFCRAEESDLPKKEAVFAVPGALTTRTGGTIYDRELLHMLRLQGWQVRHLELPGGFPQPGAVEMARAVADLQAIPGDCPVIVDGLAFGALDPADVRGIAAPVVALCHHPLALEAGLAPDVAATLAEREMANLAMAAQVVVPSPHTAAVLQAQFGVPLAKLSIAEPGVTRPGPAPAAGRTTPPLILSVGIVTPRKGHDILLKALARLTDLDWQAAIVGRVHDVAEAAALRDLAARLGLTARVAFTGEISDDRLSELYARAHLFALATRFEGYGMAFAEALCRGLPIVSCRTGAVPDTVPAAAGCLVDVDDDAAFAEAIRRLLQDPTQYRQMAAAAKAAAEDLPTWEQTANVMAAALLRAGGNGSP
ncbi:MAG: glycosyltransferase family 4 protein [Rhodobacteraceae bacterium]|nr:glycosyltransferase family 4 protein [Paracoccaceae bacterium]